MSDLLPFLAAYRATSQTEREKSSYFEELIRTYFRYEASYAYFYREGLTVRKIPLSAYDYVVNGKPALDWVMERQSVTSDKASGMTNDANLWAIKTMGNAKYPLELFLRIMTVSLETNNIVGALTPLEIG